MRLFADAAMRWKNRACGKPESESPKLIEGWGGVHAEVSFHFFSFSAKKVPAALDLSVAR
jgi:hypothetical protein